MDDSAFSTVFGDEYPAVLAFCRRRLGFQAGEDAVSEVFAIAWRRWSSAPEAVRPWLFGIAKNVVRDSRRSQTRQARLHERLGMQPRDQFEEGSDQAASIDLERAWSRLSEADREAIALVAWDELSSADAAQVLEISRVAYAARLSRARRRLRKHLHGNINTEDGGPL